MSFNYRSFDKLAGDNGLAMLSLGGISKEIPDYVTRPGGGAEVRGTRYEFPEFVVENELASVTVHCVVWNPEFSVFSMLPEQPNNWQDVEKMLTDNLGVIHRSRRSGTSVSRFIANMNPGADGTTVARVADSITRALRCKGEELKVDWLTGDELVDWYADNDGTSHSCMTGCRAESVRSWGSNPNQIRLAVFSDDKGVIARGLCFRPSVEKEFLKDELPFGPGWFYGRLYQVHSGRDRDHTGVERATAFLERKGLLDIGSNTLAGTVVPMKMSEFAPFIDRGEIYHQSTEIGSKMYYVPPRGGFSTRGWSVTENNQWGNAWGRRMEEDDADDEDHSNCCCCENRHRIDDMINVIDYGDVCRSCHENGDFNLCVDGEWRHHENTSQVCSEAWRPNEEWAESGREFLRVSCYSMGGGCSAAVRFVPAIVSCDGEEGYAPQEETVEDAGGNRIWKKLVSEGSYKLVDRQLSVSSNGWLVEERSPTYACRDNLTTARTPDGDVFDVYLASGAFNWQETQLLTEESTAVLISHPARQCKLLVDRAGQVLRFQRIGSDTVLALDANPQVVHSSLVSAYPPGARVDYIPTLSVHSHRFNVLCSGSDYGTVYYLAFTRGQLTTRWSDRVYPCGFAWNVYHSNDNIRQFMDICVQHNLPRHRRTSDAPAVFVNERGDYIDSAFQVDSKLFLLRENKVVGLYVPALGKVHMFSAPIPVESIDQLVAFSREVYNKSYGEVYEKYPITIQTQEVNS